MKKWFMLCCLGIGMMLIPTKAHAGPENWILTCDYYTAYPAGFETGNGGWVVKLNTYCWYQSTTYEGLYPVTIVEGEGWYIIYAPMPFYQKQGATMAAEAYAYTAF
jgi:hypothetical protein